ncbi:CRISPR-associated endonuclease Cas2 [Sulfidibacter corallicola]|uniref:CRISPR-associated endoribonuclease Cas2 n=1 Tax=Sulfidibacter corallicola TaxID=2818388 RepID=A0A8A4TWR5_SULCO|nr:CRISPR-associated endonuclease Cas2 [Sulfidibacter corallicola]
MLVWVMYDICEPKRLSRMAKICLRAGVYRIQKSVYVGELNRNQLDQLRLELEATMDRSCDSVFLFPMERLSFDKGNVLGVAFDKAMVSDRVRELIL